jgi:hypothetical protein
MSLLALQQDFRAWLHVGQEPSDPSFSGEARAGLDVYQNNYHGQIVTCLDESFAVTRAWLGDEAFQDAIVAHTARMPPHSWSLDHYPDDFPSTLAHNYPRDAEVAELAMLELALSQAFVAADSVPVAPGDLAGVEWDRARLNLTPSLRMCALTTNAAAIWSAITAETMPPPVELLPKKAEILVWRYSETPRFRTIDQAEADALRQIDSGMDFGSLCAALDAAGGDEPAAIAGQWLAQWISDGLIIGIEGEAKCVN